MRRDWLRPGSEVPFDGVYRVHHYQHRLSHLARVHYLYFPPCDRCGSQVCYEPLLILDVCPIAPYLRDDRDFENSAGKIPRKHEVSRLWT